MDGMYDPDVKDAEPAGMVSGDEEMPTHEEAMVQQTEDIAATAEEDVSPVTVNMVDVQIAPEDQGKIVEENADGISPSGLVVQDDMFDESLKTQKGDMAHLSKAMDVDNDVDMAQQEVVAEKKPELMEMGSEVARRVEDEDLVQSAEDADVGNIVDGVDEEIGAEMIPPPMDQTEPVEAAPVRLILRIPKRQRTDELEYVDETEDHEDLTRRHRVNVKKARGGSSGAQTRVATWSLEADNAKQGNDGSEYANDDGEEETDGDEDMDDSPAKVRKTRRSSSGRRRIVSNATVDPEEMDPTPHAGSTVTAEEDIPPPLTSDGWETYETDGGCYTCEKVGIRCFRFRQQEKGRKRWSCFRCHKRKKQCSFNDGKSSGKASKASQGGRKSEGPTELEDEDEDEDTNEHGNVGTAGKRKEKQKAPEKNKAKDKQTAQQMKKVKDAQKKRRRSSTKPGTKSKQKQKASTPAEVDKKVKKEDEDVEWQTSMFISHFFFYY